MKIVIIQDCGVEDNEGHFDSWVDTLICDENTKLEDILKWKNKLLSWGNTTIVWEVKEAKNE